MTASFKLTLDTTAPDSLIVLNSGFPKVGVAAGVPLRISTADSPLTGYQYKVWGDVDPGADEHIQATEEESDWQTLPAEENFFTEVTLSEGDGAKTIFVKVRDDVWNEVELEASVELDTTIPVITVTSGPSVPKISEIAGKKTASFTFKANEDVTSWEVRAVPNSGSNHEEGFFIEKTHGSVTQGEALAGEVVEEGKIEGEDLAAAVGADGDYVIKVFGINEAGNWSL